MGFIVEFNISCAQEKSLIIKILRLKILPSIIKDITMTRTLPHFSSPFFLAPMAGITDPALRLVCRELGAGLVVTELTSIHAILAKEVLLAQEGKLIYDFLQFSKRERPVAVQLFGSDLDALAKAAKIVEPHFDIIDYNMGCPAPHITSQMAGAALLQSPDLTRQIFRTLVSAVSKPVTLKMRCGVSERNKLLFMDIAKIAVEEGISMITLHPRTVEQGYAGKADWSLIKLLKENVAVPIVGNGDVETPEDALRMMEETGCDYVMIGRAASKNPFLFTQMIQFIEMGHYEEISFEERMNYFFHYLEYSKQFTISFENIKMHAMHFTKGSQGGARVREALLHVQDVKELRLLLEKAYLK